jgi:tetratricopeptide (TPR) repeat protein
MIAQQHLDELWDFGDAAGSERRFLDAAARTHGGDAAELLTQAARAMGLQERFDDAATVLSSITDDSPQVRARLALEQGRVLNSAGRPEDALAHFTTAERIAGENGLDFLRIDALHMLAIADPGRAEAHTTSALQALDGVVDERTLRWGVSLHNNLGWTLHEAERFDEALVEFEDALWAANSVGSDTQRFTARWAIGRCLRSLGRVDEALSMQEALFDEDPTDPYVAEELAVLRADQPGR